MNHNLKTHAYEYLERYQPEAITDTFDLLLLKSCVTLYDHTKDERYKEFVIKFFDPVYEQLKCNHGYEKYAAGSVLIFLSEIGQSDKYAKEAEQLYQEIKRYNRTKEAVISDENEEISSVIIKLSYILPFYMEYETKYNKKEHYNDIIIQYKYLNDYFEECADGDSDMLLSGFALNALADTIMAASEEIFEHYHYLRELLRQSIAYKKETSDMIDGVWFYLSVKKGCQAGALLTEKYTELLLKQESALEANQEINKNLAAAFIQGALYEI